MARIITFGELMLRLQPFNYERFVQAQSVEFTFGGGEANVAVSLANYGMDKALVVEGLQAQHQFAEGNNSCHGNQNPFKYILL